ncbi:MAG: hypothetical protein DRQ62_09910 [Gammaproteobacteria bacterium]|nr:MAG: hypothetical protein DRQ62_09910 [Gammaproteobacteria bacterium]
MKINRSQMAGILASNAVKLMNGDRVSQDKASIYAKALINGGKTGATAVENGYRVGMGLDLLA